jgi:hypothetical protein
LTYAHEERSKEPDKKRRNEETKKRRNEETKKQRNKETKKQRNKERGRILSTAAMLLTYSFHRKKQQKTKAAMGVRQGLAMDSQKYHQGPPCPNFRPFQG